MDDIIRVGRITAYTRIKGAYHVVVHGYHDPLIITADTKGDKISPLAIGAIIIAKLSLFKQSGHINPEPLEIEILSRDI